MNKNIAILGAGESGIGAAILANKKGYNVWVSDNKQIKEAYKKVLINNDIAFEENKHSVNKILKADEVIISPGIPLTAKLVEKIRSKKIPLISEIEFAFRFCKGKIIAITGSNGKTTTATMVYKILKQDGKNVVLCGNIGNSFAKEVAENTYDYWVVEVSSFQLDSILTFKPKIAIITNITPDHLDRYNNNFDEYVKSKFKIVQNHSSRDYLIVCNDDETTSDFLSKNNINSKLLSFGIDYKEKSNAYLENNNIIIKTNKNKFNMRIEELAQQGRHFVYNSMAAGIASQLLNVRKESLRNALENFENIPHRLEFVAQIHGMTFINDSKATNVNSSWYALETMKTNVIWIVGGVDKGNDYSKIKQLVVEKVSAIIALGTDNEKIISEFAPLVKSIYSTDSINEAVNISYLIGEKGDTILLSPACASFDLFENYEERGDLFKKAVRAL